MWTKVYDSLGRCRRPLVVVNALDRLSISVSFQRYKLMPLKLPLNCEVVQKVGFGPRFEEESIPQILDMRFQIAVTCEHVADFG